ncbi:hypothetical protein [Methylobacterium aquaticum]|nr:hypothetical protein [Methylobacterium aquaticum]
MAATSEPRTLEEMHSRNRLAHERTEKAVRVRRLAKAREIARRSQEAWASLIRSDLRLRREMERQARLNEAAAFRHIINRPDGETIAAIITETARHHDVPVVNLMGPGKSHPVIAARWDAIAAVHQALPHLSSLRLGHAFRRDHTTILNVLRRHHLRVAARATTPDSMEKARG